MADAPGTILWPAKVTYFDSENPGNVTQNGMSACNPLPMSPIPSFEIDEGLCLLDIFRIGRSFLPPALGHCVDAHEAWPGDDTG